MNTLEQHAIHKQLAEMGVEIVLNHGVVEIGDGQVVTNCTYTDRRKTSLSSKQEADSRGVRSLFVGRPS